MEQTIKSSNPLAPFMALLLCVCSAASGWAQETAKAPAVDPKPKWETSAAAGLTLTRGNSDTLLGTVNIVTSKKWPHNELSLGADATYGETKHPDTGASTKNAESFHGFSQYNHLFSERLFGYARLDALHDVVAHVEYRLSLGPGVGYYFIKTEKTKLSAEAGPGVVFEKLRESEQNYITLRLSERFERKISDRARIWQSAELLPQLDEFSNYLINSEIGIEADLTKDKKFSLRSYIQDTYDNEPARGRKKNDLKWVTAIAYKF
jgi:putative salt-induced outer membrane protein